MCARSLKAKSAELTTAKEAEEKLRTHLDEVRQREEAKKPDMPKLFKERDELRKQVNEHRDAIRKIQAEFNDERKEFFAYQRALRPARNPLSSRGRYCPSTTLLLLYHHRLQAVRDQKNKEYLERKAAKQARLPLAAACKRNNAKTAAARRSCI